MELSPKLLKTTASSVKEAVYGIGTVVKKIEKTSPSVGEAVERVKVPAETWGAYTLPMRAGADRAVLSRISTSGDAVIKALKLDGSAELEKILSEVAGKDYSVENFLRTLKLNKIKSEDIAKYIEEKSYGGTVEEALKQGIYTKKSLLKGLCEDIQNYSKIKNHPIFGPYNLTFSEASNVAEVLRKPSFNTREITSILERKDSNLFEKLGGNSSFDEKAGVNKAYKSLQELQKNICGISSKEVNLKELSVPINGEIKTFLYSGQLGKGALAIPKIGKVEVKTLIESNMVTKDLLENPEFISYVRDNKEVRKLISSVKIKYETPAGELVKIETDYLGLVDKATKSGLDSLSSNEIHALTDGLATVFDYVSKKDPVFAKSLIKTLEPKGNSVYGIVQDLKDAIVKSGQGKINPQTGFVSVDGTEFKDHFFMRMIDRNLVNLTENSTGRLLDLNEVVSVIAAKAKNLNPEKTGNFNMAVGGVQSHGIKLLGDFDGSKKIIESIMQ